MKITISVVVNHIFEVDINSPNKKDSASFLAWEREALDAITKMVLKDQSTIDQATITDAYSNFADSPGGDFDYVSNLINTKLDHTKYN